MNFLIPEGASKLRAAMKAEIEALAQLQAGTVVSPYQLGHCEPEDQIDRVWRERDAEQDERNRKREKDWALRLRYIR